MATIFRVVPKAFPTPSNPIGFTIEGISARINTADIGDQTKYPFSFVFYSKDAENNWIPKDGADIPVRVLIPLPSVGNVNIVSLLLSPSKTDKYRAASIICGFQGYQLLPIEDQDTLLDVI